MSFFNLFYSAPFFISPFNAAFPQTTFSVPENGVIYNVLPTPTFSPFSFWNGFSSFQSLNINSQIININGAPVGNGQTVGLPSGATVGVLNQFTGLFTYSPNTEIDILPGQPFIDSFNYTFLNFFGRLSVANVQVIVYDGGTPPLPPPPVVIPQFTPFNDTLDLNTITDNDITTVGLAAYQSALAGNDYAVLPDEGTPLTLAGFYNTLFQANSGNDTIVINGAIGLALNQVIIIEGNTGDDQFFVEGAGQQVGKLFLEGGTGVDQYTIDGASLITELTVDDNGLLEDDILTLTAPVSDSTLDLGFGADIYNIAGDLSATRILDNDGAQLIFINGSVTNGSLIEFLPSASIDSTITVILNVDSSFIRTGAGNDEITVLETVDNGEINAYDGDNVISVDSLTNSTVRFGSGANTVDVLGDVSDTNIIDNQLTSGPITDTQGDVINIQGNLINSSSIALANGDHLISVFGTIVGSGPTSPLFIETLAGNDTLAAIGNIQFAQISLGSGNDSLEAAALDTSGVDLGDGADTVTVNDLSNSEIDVATGLGNVVSSDNISNSTITMGGSNVDDSADSSLSVTAANNITGTTFQLLDTLNGNQLELSGSISSSSQINGSDGDDTITFNQVQFFNSTIDLSQTGNDQIILGGAFSFINDSTLILGNGNNVIDDQTTIAASLESNSISIVGNTGINTNVDFNVAVIDALMSIDDTAADINTVTFAEGIFGSLLTGSSGRDVIDVLSISANGATGSSFSLQGGNDLLSGINSATATVFNSSIDMGIGDDTISDFSDMSQAFLALGTGDDILDNIQFITDSSVLAGTGNDQITNIGLIRNSQFYLEDNDDTLVVAQMDTNSLVDAGQGNDTINIASGANSTVFDGEGSDAVTLGSGNIDIISLSGTSPGDGFADSFIFVDSTSIADHSITGFTQNEDVIDLTSFGLSSAGDLNFQFDGSDTTITGPNPSYEITVIGVELTAANVGTDIII